jgi:hypothetical protein
MLTMAEYCGSILSLAGKREGADEGSKKITPTGVCPYLPTS